MIIAFFNFALEPSDIAVQSLKLCSTLCNPMNCNMSGFPVHYIDYTKLNFILNLTSYLKHSYICPWLGPSIQMKTESSVHRAHLFSLFPYSAVEIALEPFWIKNYLRWPNDLVMRYVCTTNFIKSIYKFLGFSIKFSVFLSTSMIPFFYTWPKQAGNNVSYHNF